METLNRNMRDLGFANGWDSDCLEARLVEMAKLAGYKFEEKLDQRGYDNVYTCKEACLKYHTCSN